MKQRIADLILDLEKEEENARKQKEKSKDDKVKEYYLGKQITFIQILSLVRFHLEDKPSSIQKPDIEEDVHGYYEKITGNCHK